MTTTLENGGHRNGEQSYLLNLPIGTGMTGLRIESDSLGDIQVPADHYWGAQTQRSLTHCAIGDDRMPKSVYHAYGYIKKAAAAVNSACGRLPRWKAEIIELVADEVISGQLDAEFPLYLWQSGSGTHVNMNVNEVISNRAIQLVGGTLGSKQPFHPHDDVNRGQSSNDTFPTAMHIAAVLEIQNHLLPRVQRLTETISAKSREWRGVVKIGRTHLQDAVPLTVGQEWSGYAAQLEDATGRVRETVHGLYQVPVGGTAVGTGINAPAGFTNEVTAAIGNFLELPFVSAPNMFAALGGLDALVHAMAGLKSLAVSLMKIANDVRWLASGPRCGLGELRLPANEPGSSIMPGKINPTQCEILVMVCIQVMAEDVAVAFAGSQGNFELNVMRPIIIGNFLHSARILADACDKFREYCISGIELNRERIAEDVGRSLMLATALSPVIGYDRAAAIVQKAAGENLTLREAAIADGCLTSEQFDEIMEPTRMVGRE
jgi:fumarate hydratase class II